MQFSVFNTALPVVKENTRKKKAKNNDIQTKVVLTWQVSCQMKDRQFVLEKIVGISVLT